MSDLIISTLIINRLSTVDCGWQTTGASVHVFVYFRCIFLTRVKKESTYILRKRLLFYIFPFYEYHIWRHKRMIFDWESLLSNIEFCCNVWKKHVHYKGVSREKNSKIHVFLFSNLQHLFKMHFFPKKIKENTRQYFWSTFVTN